MFFRTVVSATAAALLLGPPSIKIEIITNSATAPVRGAVFMIAGHHHVTTEGIHVSGRAEGIVAGKRISRALTLTPAGSEGVYGVTRQWDAGTPWVLVFTVSADVHDSNGVAEAAVRIGADGRVLGIDYPMGKLAGGYPWPRRVAPHEIDGALAAMARK